MAELRKTKKETLAGLAEAFPGVASFEIGFQGAGDNFDSFYDYTAYDAEGKVIDIHSGFSNENKFLQIAEDYIWYVMDNAHNQPDFNNDGSDGTVTFDMVNKVVTLQVNYQEDVTPDYDGDEDDPDYDQKRDEYWDNMDERDYDTTPMPPEIF
jgi:hypothetical protein